MNMDGEHNFVSREEARVTTEEEAKKAWFHTTLGQRLLRRIKKAKDRGEETVSLEDTYGFDDLEEFFEAGWNWGKAWGEHNRPTRPADLLGPGKGIFN